MRELSQLTMEQYVAIVCGDVEPIQATGRREAEEARRRLIGEFAQLSDPVGTAAYVSRRKAETDDRATLLLFSVLSNLVVMRETAEARRILAEYGINAEGMTDQQVEAEVGRRLRRAKSMVERAQSDEEERPAPKAPEEIRRLFDRQAASLMTYFKMQIDFSTVKATTFAYMVEQADREIKAKQAMLAKI